ncbi:MAG: thioredoxin family protein [Dermatophilaceae bacterium]
MRIKVLGPGCRNCQKLEQNTQAALDQLGLQEQIEKVTDYGEIAGYGVMKTPALVIDDDVVLSGRVATPDEITALINAVSY